MDPKPSYQQLPVNNKKSCSKLIYFCIVIVLVCGTAFCIIVSNRVFHLEDELRHQETLLHRLKILVDKKQIEKSNITSLARDSITGNNNGPVENSNYTVGKKFFAAPRKSQLVGYAGGKKVGLCLVQICLCFPMFDDVEMHSRHTFGYKNVREKISH